MALRSTPAQVVDLLDMAQVPAWQVTPGMMTLDGVVLEVEHITKPGDDTATVVRIRHHSVSYVEPMQKGIPVFADLTASAMLVVQEAMARKGLGADMTPALSIARERGI